MSFPRHGHAAIGRKSITAVSRRALDELVACGLLCVDFGGSSMLLAVIHG